MRFAQVHGHLLVLTLSNMVYAFDLLEQKKLWEYNLLGKSPVNMSVVQTMTGADGTMTVVYADGTKQRLGQLGIVESSYVCLPTREGLLALDPSSGAVLWTKEAASASMLFGDATHVFIVETGADGTPSRTQVVRAADGVSVKVQDFGGLFHPNKRLHVQGRYLLSFDEDSKGKVLRLYDILNGKDAWRQQFPANSIAIRTGDPRIAGAVDPQGNVTLVDVFAQKSILSITDPNERIQAEHLAGVQEIRLYSDRDRFFLALNKAPEAGVNVIPYVSNGLRSGRVNGMLYGYDRVNGQLQWYTMEPINTFMLLEQIEDLPILIFAAHHNRFNNRGGEQMQVKVEALDKKSGKLIFADRPISPNGQFYAMQTDPKAGVIELMRYDIKVRFSPEGSASPAPGAGAPGAPRGAMPAIPVAPQALPMQKAVMPAQRIQLRIAPAQIVPAPPAKPAEEKPKPKEEPKKDEPKKSLTR
jgi:outer membrane protein assembly factor BamB